MRKVIHDRKISWFPHVFRGKKAGRLVLSLCVLLLVAVAVIFGVVYETYCGSILTQELKRLLSISRASASNMQLYMKDKIDYLTLWGADDKTVSAVSQAENGAKAPLQQVLRSILKNCADLETVFVAGPDGRLLGCEAKLETRWAKWSDSMLPDLQQRKYSSISTVFLKEKNGYAFALHAPVFQKGVFKCSIIGVIPFDTVYSQQLKFVRVGNKGYLMVQDMDGSILYYPDQTQIGKNLLTIAQNSPEDYSTLISGMYRKERGKAIYEDVLDTDAPLVLQAYCRANIGKHFFILSAVLDYEEAMSITKDNLWKAQWLVLCALLLLLCCTAAILSMYKHQQKLSMEKIYLSEMNTALRELNESNDQLRHSEKMQTIGVFTSGIAHELNNVLAPMVAYSEILMQHEQNDPTAAENANEIYTSSLRAKEMIRQILQFSRAERQDNCFDILDLTEILKKSVRLVSVMLPQNIRISLKTGNDDLRVRGNATQLHQCLVNLCKNAMEAMPEGGNIRVMLRKRLCQENIGNKGFGSAVRLGDTAEIDVVDNGTGMDDETLRRIFDPFFSTKDKKEGTGLGLSIVRDTVARHGGMIYASSFVGQGSRFTILLPLEQGAPQIQKEKGLTESAGKDVLAIVRDAKSIRVIRKLALTHQIEVSSDSLKALELFRQDPLQYRTIITDYLLPNMSGNMLAYNIKRINGRTRIIMLTHLTQDDLRGLGNLGIIDEIVTEPVSVGALYKRLKESLSSDAEKLS